MKTVYDIPKKEDLYKVEELYIDEQQFRQNVSHHQKDIIFHRKSRINLKQVLDYCDHPIRVEVIDEDKFQEFKKTEIEWLKKVNEFRSQQNAPAIPERYLDTPHEINIMAGVPYTQHLAPHNSGDILNEFEPVPALLPTSSDPAQDAYTLHDRPRPPKKTITIPCIRIMYFNTAYKIIVKDLDDFENDYFNYLKMQKLDIDIKD